MPPYALSSHSSHPRKPWGRRSELPRLRGRAAVERRLRVLARFPVCGMCRRAASTAADHIVNLARGGADDESNMQGLCEPCHALKTQRESMVGRSRARFKSVTRW